MTDENRQLLDERIREKLEEIGQLESGSEEYGKAYRAVLAMIDKSNECDKLDYDYDKKMKELEQAKTQFELSKEIEIEQTKADRESRESENKKNRIVTIGTFVAGILVSGLGMLFKREFMRETMEFEKTDSVTTSAGKNGFRDFLRFK